MLEGRPVVVRFASYSGLLGGAERVLLDCVTRLERPLTVACPEGPLAAALRAAGVAHQPLPERTLRLGPAHAAGLLAMARDLRREPGLLVAWGARAVLAAAPRQSPWIAVHHDLYASAALRAALNAATRRAAATVAASHAVAEQFGGTVLHPGVDLGAFSPAPLPSGPPRALVLGALVGWKRPELALEVAARIPELRLTYAGAPLPGGEDAALRARAARLGDRVAFAGAVEDVGEALASAHVLLHCADAEPYGLALVEALAAGRPVVAPDAAGPREIVRDGAGRLYPPGDADAAAAALRAVLGDPAAP